MMDCNVSTNALAGISVVSRQNMFLTVTGLYLVGEQKFVAVAATEWFGESNDKCVEV